MSLMSLRRRRAATKGFNLIEAAIVLGIVGLVVGGIWVAATSVYANLRSKQSTDTLLSVVQGVRALFATSSSTGVANATDLTPVLAQSNVLPSNTLTALPGATTSANTVNAWGGNLAVFSTNNNNGVAQGGFQVQFTRVPSSACVDFISRNVGQGRDTGMYHVDGVAAAAAAHLAVAAGAGNLLNGAVLTTATIADVPICNAVANLPVNVSFYFNLRG